MSQGEVASPPLCVCHGVEMLWKKDAQRKAGGYWRCRIASREMMRTWRAANPGRVRTWRAAYREKELEGNRTRYAANLERERERLRARRAANPEKYREYTRRWKKANPEKVRETNGRRLIVSGMYLGMVGFTQREREEILSGASK